MSEIASNALMHGAGPVSVRGWITHQRLICTITDRGNGFDDPLAGFLPTPVNGLPVHGAGLWLTRNFSDSLDFSTTAEGVHHADRLLDELTDATARPLASPGASNTPSRRPHSTRSRWTMFRLPLLFQVKNGGSAAFGLGRASRSP